MIRCLRAAVGSEPFLDVHLMVSRPEAWVAAMADAGATQFTFHLEAAEDPAAEYQ